MKKLFVVRHAKSSWSRPELDDIDRPLNKRGKRNAPEMGRRLADRGVKPEVMISSPAKRARSTASRIANEISFPKEGIRIEPRLYHGSIESMLSVIRETGADKSSLMIFGHNPGITDLVNYLTGSDIYNIPTCGIAEIDFDISTWEGIGDANGKLVSFDFPKNVYTNQV